MLHSAIKLLIALAVSYLFGVVPSGGQTPCDISVPSSVEVHNPDLSLADLLGPDACRAIVEAASAVRLGKLPLAGSVRVIEGSQVRVLLDEVSRKLHVDAAGNSALRVPDRISVRGGSQLSCAEIGEKVLPGLSRNLECGSAGRIPRKASLEVVRRLWDPATRTWRLVVRCSHPGDCVPFLVRVPEADPAAAGALRSQQATRKTPPRGAHSSSPVGENVLVHPGESAALVWEQDRIRAVVRVVCLEPGREGKVVRARLANTSRTVRAVVVARGQLRAQS
jgi:Chaperone for flagella basal body P-ring formation